MADFKELVPAIRKAGPWGFTFRTWQEIGRDNLLTLAAAMAYSWLFAVFPFVIFLLTLAPYLPEKQKLNAQEQINTFVQEMIPHQAQSVLDSLEYVLKEPRTGLLSFGLIATLWTASGGVSMTMSALDAAFDAEKFRPFYIQRPIAIALTIVMVILILLVFVLLPIGSGVITWLIHRNLLPTALIWAVDVLRYILAVLLMLAALMTLYKFGTSVKQRLIFFSPGAIFTVIAWLVLGASFRFYVDKFGEYNRTYGAVGGVAIILLLFYLDALVLLVGAEINSEVDRVMKDTPPLPPTGPLPVQ
jgi:membrane protein